MSAVTEIFNVVVLSRTEAGVTREVTKSDCCAIYITRAACDDEYVLPIAPLLRGTR